LRAQPGPIKLSHEHALTNIKEELASGNNLNR
jgi:hypothetical protein